MVKFCANVLLNEIMFLSLRIMKKVTIKDVAREAGVSTTLVSRVLNAPLKENGLPDCSVRDVTARRILNTVRYLGYHPNKAAVSLRKTLRKRIGVILPDISNPYFADIAKFFGDIAHKNDYIVLFGSSDGNPDKLWELAEAFLLDGVDGMIVIPGYGCGEVVKKIVAEGVPVVIAIRDYPEIENMGRIMTDDALATRMALDHLVSNGFRKIEMVSQTLAYSNILNRESMFSEYLEGLGQKPIIHHTDINNKEDSIRYILEDAVRRGTDALYCPNAPLALLCGQECRRQGINIPGDIALMGYDGGSIFSHTWPSVTQIEFNREAVAEEAFSIFLAMREHPGIIPETRYLAPRLIPSDSTARTAARASLPISDADTRRAKGAIEDITRALSRLQSSIGI